VKLWDFQEKAIQDTRAAFAKNKRVILSMPTGSGKTVVALMAVKSALDKGRTVAFVCDRLTLLDQTANFMFKQGLEFGIVQGDNPLTDYGKQFQICSAMTLAKRKKQYFDFYILDECHIKIKHQLDLLGSGDGSYFLGLTATPFTRGLGKHWEALVTSKRTGDLIDDGFLSAYEVYGPSKPDLTGIKMSAGDYNKKDLADRTDKKKLIGDIVEHWFKLAPERHTIVMAVNVAHAEHIAESFKEKGVNADVIHCYMDRDEVRNKLQAFRDGKLQMLSSVDMISRGFDMPRADCLICARPTKSLNYHLQALGRVLRIHDEKKNALILDHAGNIERLGFPCDEFLMELDMGIVNKKKKEKDDKKPLPKPCPKCFFMKPPAVRECPRCGFKSEKQHLVETKEGMLKKLQKGRLKSATPESKDKLYAKLLAGARAAGFQSGWAAHKYRENFGVWPARRVQPDIGFYQWAKDLPRRRLLAVIYDMVGGMSKKAKRIRTEVVK